MSFSPSAMTFYDLDANHMAHQIPFESWIATGEASIRLFHEEVGGVEVSTVFLKIPPSIIFDRPDQDPLLFELAVISDEGFQLMARFFTYGEAEQGHRTVVESLKEHACSSRAMCANLLADVQTRLRSQGGSGRTSRNKA